MAEYELNTTLNDLPEYTANLIVDFRPDKLSQLTNDVGYITSSSVGNATITITQNGVTKGSFTTNQSANATIELDAGGGSSVIEIIQKNGTNLPIVNKTVNIPVPTKTSDLTNDSGFITSSYHDNTKQDIINDLATIRSNATNGQSAYTTIGSYGNIVTHNTNEFATSAQGNLADSALQPNDNITELNNNAGYITGITSSDVITALGYTPENVSNKVNAIGSLSTDSQYPSVKAIRNYHDSTKQNVINNSNKLSSDYVNDSGYTNKFVTANEKSKISTLNLYYEETNNDIDLETVENSSEGADYGFSYGTFSERTGLCSDNIGVDDSYSYAKISFNVEYDTDIIVRFYQCSEQNYDYGVISDIDEELPNDNTSTGSEYWNGQNYSEITSSITYQNVEAGEHFFTCKYIKDGSSEVPPDLFMITGISFGIEKGIYKYGTQEDINVEFDTNKVTSISSSSTDTEYPSAKCVYDYHDSTKYDTSNPSGYQANVLEGVQINSSDLVITNKKVNIPIASTSDLGVVKVDGSTITINNGVISSDIGNGTITVTQGGTTKGTFTVNQSGDTTIALDGGGGGTILTAGNGIGISATNKINIVQEDGQGQFDINATVVGSLSISGSNISGFGSSNYLELPRSFAPSTSTWEVCTKVKVSSHSSQSTTDHARFFVSTNRDPAGFVIGVTDSTPGTYSVWISFNGSTLTQYNSATTLSVNTWYWIKAIYNGTDYKVYSSTTGEFNGEEILDITINSNSPVYQTTDVSRLGNHNGYASNYDLDLSGCYMKIGGSTIWTGMLSYGAVAKATNSLYGLVKPDNSTITVNDGVISANALPFSNITGSPYTNSNLSNALIAKQDALTSLNAGDNISIIGGGHSLPEAYQEVEFIQSSGEQYIDTGVIGNQDTGVIIKHQFYTNSSTAGSGRVFGSRTTATSNCFSFGSMSGKSTYGDKFFFGYDNQDTMENIDSLQINTWYIFEHDRITHKINGISYTKDYTYTSFNTPSTLKIFGFDQGGTMGYGIAKCAYGEIYESNVLIANFIPCYRKSDSKPGMYDLVTNTFFTNANTSASTDFTVGPDVNPTTKINALNGLTATVTELNYSDGVTSNIQTQLDGKEITSNKVTSISSSSTDTEYPSAKCMYDIVGDIETLLQGLR